MKYLKASQVSFSYTEYPFLHDINFTINGNDGCIILAGRNGVGKSTLLNIINDLLSYEGSIDNKFKTVAYLPYEDPLFDKLSVEQNIKFYYRCYNGENISFENQLVKQVLQALSINYLKRKVCICSSGEKKKTALACLLLSNADLFILDEPFVALDKDSVIQLISLINDWKQEKTFLITTHSAVFAEKFVDRLLVLDEGTLSIDTVDKREIKEYFEGY